MRLFSFFFFLLISINLVLAAVGTDDFTQGKVVYTDPDFTNYSLVPTVNSSDWWDSLDFPNATQMEEVNNELTIKESWLTSFGNLIWCALTGCDMTGDLSMGGNNIDDVENLNVGGDANFTGNFSTNCLNCEDGDVYFHGDGFFAGNVTAPNIEIMESLIVHGNSTCSGTATACGSLNFFQCGWFNIYRAQYGCSWDLGSGGSCGGTAELCEDVSTALCENQAGCVLSIGSAGFIIGGLGLTGNLSINITGNITADWFNGRFNWTATLPYLDFDGSVLDYNETHLNLTIDDKLRSVNYNATQIDTVAGTLDSGDLASILIPEDDDSYNVSEVAGANPLIIDINFTSITNFDSVIGRIYYAGGQGHEVQLEIRRVDTGVWENYAEFTDMTSFVNFYVPVFDSLSHIDEYGNVSVRFSHFQVGNPGHDFSIDFINIVDGWTALTTADHDGLSGRDDPSNHPWALDRNGTNNMTANLTLDIGYNVTASYFYGDGSFLTGSLYAQYQFDANNFNGSGNFVTTGNASFEEIFLGSKISHIGDTNTVMQLGSDQWNFITGGSSRFIINNAGVTLSNGDMNLGAGDLLTTGQINLGLDGHNIITASRIAGELRLGAGGETSDLIIDTGGNVNIGENLNVGGDITMTSNTLTLGDDSSPADSYVHFKSSGGDGFFWYDQSANQFLFNAGTAEIKAGIVTAKKDVTGITHSFVMENRKSPLSADDGGGIEFRTAGAVVTGYFDVALEDASNDNSYMRFSTRGSDSVTEKMRITSDGDLKIVNDNAKLMFGDMSVASIFANATGLYFNKEGGMLSAFFTDFDDYNFDNDVYIKPDSAKIYFGADNDSSITDTGFQMVIDPGDGSRTLQVLKGINTDIIIAYGPNPITVGDGTYGVDFDGRVSSIPDEITASEMSPGTAISIQTLNTEITTPDAMGTYYVSLEDGSRSGQIKHIYIVNGFHDMDTLRITPVTLLGGAYIQFNTELIGKGVTLVWADNEGWSMVGTNGGFTAG